MSRRDVLISALLTLFATGGAAIIAALTTTPAPITPMLMWGGLAAVLLAGLGLTVMLFVAPPVAERSGQTLPRQPLSDNASFAIVMGMAIGVPGVGIALVNIANALRPDEPPPPIAYVPPTMKGPLGVDLSRLSPEALAATRGKSTQISATITQLHQNNGSRDYTALLTQPKDKAQVYAVFNDPNIGRYVVGDHVYGTCIIEQALTTVVTLGSCRVISAQDWAK